MRPDWPGLPIAPGTVPERHVAALRSPVLLIPQTQIALLNFSSPMFVSMLAAAVIIREVIVWVTADAQIAATGLMRVLAAGTSFDGRVISRFHAEKKNHLATNEC